MSATALLAEARESGVDLFRVGDQVRWEAASTPDPSLLGRLRAAKNSLLGLLPSRVDYRAIYRDVAAGCGDMDDLRAAQRAWEHGQDVIAELKALERRCDELADAHVPEREYEFAVWDLVSYFERLRETHGED